MSRIRFGLITLVLAVALAGCDAGSITAAEDCAPKYPTMGSDC